MPKKSLRARMLAFLSVVLLGSLLVVLSAKAAEVQNSQEISGAVQTVLTQNTVPVMLRDPRLTDEEWLRYGQLMQGMDGHWYAQLSPAAVLGLHAETEADRRHYAELVAREQHA